MGSAKTGTNHPRHAHPRPAEHGAFARIDRPSPGEPKAAGQRVAAVRRPRRAHPASTTWRSGTGRVARVHYPATIITVLGDDRYRVHYEGYGNEWDEDIALNRILRKGGQ